MLHATQPPPELPLLPVLSPERDGDREIEGLLQLAAGLRGGLHVGRVEPFCERARSGGGHRLFTAEPELVEDFAVASEVGLCADQDDGRRVALEFFRPAGAGRVEGRGFDYREAEHEHVGARVA